MPQVPVRTPGCSKDMGRLTGVMLCRERVLFLGWRRDMHDMIEVLDQFVSKGSELFLYNEVRALV